MSDIVERLRAASLDGCGSQEFIGMTPGERNALCEIYERARGKR